MTDYNSYKSWPFNEAKKIIKRYEKNNTKDKIIFETGYGPSGLPHIGTFGEVLRTNMVRFCYEKLTGKETDLIAFSDDMDGFRKVPDNIPNKEKLSNYLDYPLTSVPDPFELFNSFGEHNNSKLKDFLNTFNLPFSFQSSTDAYKSGLLNETINIEFSEPLKNINNLKELDDSSDLKILGYTDKDSIRMEYTFSDPFTLSITNDISINYIKLFQDNIKDISNNILLDSITTISINDLTKIENTFLDNSKTGSIIGTVNYSGDVPIIINAKNIENNLNFFTMVQNDKYKFNFLPSGKYILWGYESLNVLDSTRYFSGIWNPYQRSSKFIIYPDTIDVRARWTIDELNMDFK